MGWQREGFYAFGNGVFFKNKFYPADEYGIVRLPDLGNYYLPSSSKIYKDDARLFTFEKQFVHLNYSSVTLEEFTTQLFKVFGDNGRVGFAFYLATLFRDVVTNASAEHWFPILNLFGPKWQTTYQRTLIRPLGRQSMSANTQFRAPPHAVLPWSAQT